jgi:hypothetical protein
MRTGEREREGERERDCSWGFILYGPEHFSFLHDLRNAQEHERAKGICLGCTRDDQSVELETAIELYKQLL